MSDIAGTLRGHGDSPPGNDRGVEHGSRDATIIDRFEAAAI